MRRLTARATARVVGGGTTMARSTIRLNGKDLATALGKRPKRRMPSGKQKILAPAPALHEPGEISGEATEKPPVFDSEDEMFYADLLEVRKASGKIKDWAFQPERFRLGKGAWYTPDFRVVNADNSVQFVEVKGYQREAALVRLKVAATLHPYKFTMIRRRPAKAGGGWEVIWDSHGPRSE